MTNDNSLVKLEQSLEAKSMTDMINDATDYPMLLIDVSGSMQSSMKNGKTRLQGLQEVFEQIVKDNGQPTMVAFGGFETSEPRFVDRVPEAGGGTPLHQAIALAKTYGATRLVVISDGCPDLEGESLIQAKEFGGTIDVYFVGDAGDYGSEFLDRLAKLTGGQRFNGDLSQTKQLAAGIAGLLMGAVDDTPERTIFAAGTDGTVEDTGIAAEPVVESDDEDDDDEDDDDEDDDDEDDDEEGE